MNYAELYALLAERAVIQGTSNLQTFVRQMVASGASEKTIEQLLLEDLKNDGPVFGSFFKMLSRAGESSVAAAHRAGTKLAQVDALVEAVDSDQIRARLRSLAVGDTDDVVQEMLDNANPDQLESLTMFDAEIELTWVAELVNTCNRCLPLHGKTMSAEDWRGSGLDPTTIHAGWASDCHCLLKTESETGGKSVSPLRRIPIKDSEGNKISRKTARVILGNNTEKALAAVAKAKDSEIGRRTLDQIRKINAE